MHKSHISASFVQQNVFIANFHHYLLNLAYRGTQNLIIRQQLSNKNLHQCSSKNCKKEQCVMYNTIYWMLLHTRGFISSYKLLPQYSNARNVTDPSEKQKWHELKATERGNPLSMSIFRYSQISRNSHASMISNIQITIIINYQSPMNQNQYTFTLTWNPVGFLRT